MSKIIIGRYIPGNSIIYKMDPRGKIIATFLFIVIIFLANNWCETFNLADSFYISFAAIFYYWWKSLLALGNF